MRNKIKNLKKAAERIKTAVKNKEKIILYGDADLDGVASVIILKESIQNLGGRISAIYFPDRETEGYGLSKIGLNYLKKFSPALLITIDCGISNFKEAKLAKKIGFETMIIDHHEILEKLPEAKIIVDPKQKGDKYPFKGLASAGIVFKLSELLLENRLTKNLRRNFLELSALATVADMMPRQADNEILIEEGLSFLKKSWRPGLKVFFEISSFKSYPNFDQKVSRIISILNVRDVKNRLPASFRLLTSVYSEDARKIVQNLLVKNEARKEKIGITLEKIEFNISKKTKEPIIFEGESSFDLTLISSVASILCRKYKKPVFLFKKLRAESQGTIRTPKDVDSVALMKKCSKYPLAFGGHPQASGFRIKNENLKKFKKCLIENITHKKAITK